MPMEEEEAAIPGWALAPIMAPDEGRVPVILPFSPVTATTDFPDEWGAKELELEEAV